MLRKIIDNRFLKITLGAHLIYMGLDFLGIFGGFDGGTTIVAAIMGICWIAGGIGFIMMGLKR